MSVASRAILSNFFEEQGTQNYPQYLSGLSRALFPTTFLEIPVKCQQVHSNKPMSGAGGVYLNNIINQPFAVLPALHSVLVLF